MPDAAPNSQSKNKLARFGCPAGVVALALALWLGVPRLFYPVFGEPYFDTAWDRAKLRTIASKYEPLLQRLERYRAAQGDYPESLEELPADEAITALSAEDARSLIYARRPSEGYTLYVKLNWDGGLRYSPSAGQWRYDPGSDPDWPIGD
ncbi:MAG: hypothetical protein R3F11_08945 [Verrucomicrobiales bacterium]